MALPSQPRPPLKAARVARPDALGRAWLFAGELLPDSATPFEDSGRATRADLAKQIVIGQLGSRIAHHNGICLGFVIMPDHVHAMAWFPETDQLSSFMNKWKDQTSHALKDLLRTRFPNYWSKVHEADPIWQPRYYGFNIWSRAKVEEKLHYMHENPVRAGLVEKAVLWRWSSARWYLDGKSVGLPIRWPPGLESD
jgi:putative transposase